MVNKFATIRAMKLLADAHTDIFKLRCGNIAHGWEIMSYHAIAPLKILNSLNLYKYIAVVAIV